MEKIHLFAEAYLPKLSTFFDLMAGFLTCSPSEVFPSKTTVTFVGSSGLFELTAAGTVQDSHLLPSRDFRRNLSPLNRSQRYIFYLFIGYVHNNICTFATRF